MLVAEYEGIRVEAVAAQRGLDYRCPKCRSPLILRQGRKVIAHFAHKPPTDCTWAKGETKAHLEAKALIQACLKARGMRAELEFVVPALPGDRRADVMAWSAEGRPLAIELQHTSIGLDEIEARALSYAQQGIAQFWIPFLRDSAFVGAQPTEGGKLFVEEYSPRPFEKWVHGLSKGDGMWTYEPSAKRFWHAKLAGRERYKELSTWYEAGGQEVSAGGYSYFSKRYRELTLTGPFSLEELSLMIFSRSAATKDVYNWPAGFFGKFATSSASGHSQL
jgi:hypothetical protein